MSRNRVVRALRFAGMERAEHFGKWSCVRNPYDRPTYSLPYGFVQSPIIATLVLSSSGIGSYLREISNTVTVSVYIDDIVISADSLRNTELCYSELLKVIELSGFQVNRTKTIEPNDQVSVFNCDLKQGETIVSFNRQAKFYAKDRSQESILGFELYCNRVLAGNC